MSVRLHPSLSDSTLSYHFMSFQYTTSATCLDYRLALGEEEFIFDEDKED